MESKESTRIMDRAKISRAITRIAHEVLERNGGAESLVIVGILTRGADLAHRLAAEIEQIEGVKVPVGLMDISLYRDDVNLKTDQPVVRQTDILFNIDGRNMILVDDVLYTGRTIRAALSQIIEFGRPLTIQLAVLIDRGHRQLPIRPDFVGKNIPTGFGDKVRVYFEDEDGKDEVWHYRTVSDAGKDEPAGEGK